MNHCSRISLPVPDLDSEQGRSRGARVPGSSVEVVAILEEQARVTHSGKALPEFGPWRSENEIIY